MHHAGLLPIVKEVVEMLFCRGVIKVKMSENLIICYWSLSQDVKCIAPFIILDALHSNNQ